jgi:P27 family predicted phage terminase small subunit
VATRGPRPKPTALKVIQGTDRADRRNECEPVLATRIPECPEHLAGEAKREWERTTKLLAAAGLVAEIDRAALASYCQAWGRWVEAEEALRRHGVVIKSPNNFPMPSPYLAIANKAMDQMRLLLTEFGMTPSSRARVVAMPDTESIQESRRELEEQRARRRAER